MQPTSSVEVPEPGRFIREAKERRERAKREAAELRGFVDGTGDGDDDDAAEHELDAEELGTARRPRRRGDDDDDDSICWRLRRGWDRSRQTRQVGCCVCCTTGFSTCICCCVVLVSFMLFALAWLWAHKWMLIAL